MIKGERVELWPVTEADLVRQFEWRNDEEVAKGAAGSEAAEYSNQPLESLRAMYAEAVRSTLPSDNLRGCVFSVYTLSGVHIGTCDYRDVRPVARTATIGVTIGDKAYWNQGYGTDVIRTLVRYLFLQLNLNRVQLDTWSGNTRAIRAYEKCGFVVEGRLRQNEYVAGSYYDTVIMGLLHEDFFRQTKAAGLIQGNGRQHR